ncbi:MAG TPA: sigma-70 family RNA polymerase sigma factor [Myxococcales bacterium]|nr:sigma-70 family RNA polymerase sigma factor [Myxococcales bacterium]
MPDGGQLEALIGRAQQGDVRAFEQLISAQLPQIRRYALAFGRSEADAADLAQEALVKAYTSLRLFRFQSAFSSWLYAIVHNVFLDHVRSRRGREQQMEEPLDPTRHERTAEAATPDEQLAREEERRRLWVAIRQVPVDLRSALVLFDIEGHTYDEISAIEGVPVGTVKSRLFRGREALRKVLGQAGEVGGTSPASAPSQRERSVPG